MSAEQQCDRYPCDLAYRRGTHEPNADGEIVHQVRAGSELRLDDAGELVTVWSASAVAFDDGRWPVHVYVSEGGHRVFADPDEANRFRRRREPGERVGVEGQRQ